MQDRLVAGIGTTAFVLLFGYLLFIGLDVQVRRIVDQPLILLGLASPHAEEQPKPPGVVRKIKTADAASPRNLKNVPTEVVAVAPLVPPVRPPPVVSAPVVGSGTAAAAGASNQPGPGEGAGGEGDGSGDGDGDGGGGGDNMPPRLIKGKLGFQYLPPALRQAGVGGTVGVRYRVEANGHVDDCTVTRSSGNAELDAATCALIQQRFRYKPSRDPDGNPIGSIIVENQSWIMDSTAPKSQP